MNHKTRFHRNSEHIGSDATPFCVFGGLLPALQAHSSQGSLNNPLSDHPQVAQGKQCYQLGGVLGQPFVANLGETKLTFKNSEGMLHLGSDTGLELFGLVEQVAPRRVLIQCSALAWTHGNLPAHIGGLRAFLDPLVSGITKSHAFLTVQQSAGLGNVMHVGRCTDDGVNQPGNSVHPDVGFHSEVPLIALIGLMHLGITLTRTVLGRARCSNQGGIYYGAGLEQQAPLGQGGVDGRHDLQAQVVGFEQMAKPQNGGFIGQACGTGIKSCKFTVQRRVMQRLFHGWVRQAKPLLKEMNTQHGLNRKRWASTFCAGTTGCKRLDQTHQFRPGYNQVHLVEEHAFAGALSYKLESSGGKVDLFHIRLTSRHLVGCQGFQSVPRYCLNPQCRIAKLGKKDSLVNYAQGEQ
jgi:hypothetical protein